MGKHLRKLAGLCLFALLLGACVAGSPNPGGAGDDPSVVDPPVVDPEPTYTITWKNYDDSVLEIDREVSYGATPKYDGKTPVRPDDDTYSYTFSGWDPGLKPVTADATYKAIYIGEKIKHFYTIDFDLDGGTSSSYSGPKTVEEFSKDLLFFDCVKEGWSFRGWSYQGTKVFDEKGNQLATFSMEKEMTFVATYTQTAKLTITTNMEGAGSISGEGEYPYNTYVDVSVVPNQGYDFVGWYYDNTILSSTPDYKYMMWSEDVTLEARFKLASFNLTIYSNNKDYGLVLLKSGTNSKYLSEYAAKRAYTDPVTVAAYSKTDVRFLGWYDEDNNLVETNAVYSFVMPNHDYSLEAKWDHFTINYVLNGGTNNPSNPTEYSTESGNITLGEPSRPDYEFVGWTLDDEQVTTIDPTWVRNVTLVANWRGAQYQLLVMSNDESKGAVSVLTGDGHADEDVVVSATPKNGCLFKGWYHEGVKVSEETTYTFIMPFSGYTLTACFWTQDENAAWDMAHGIVPTLSNDANTIVYGLYPQTRVSDSSLLTALDALTDIAKGSNGWYLFNDEYYAKLVANPYNNGRRFNDGETIEKGVTYWFKCEPIEWDVLSGVGGEYYVLSDVLLDAHCYSNSDWTRTIGGQTVYRNNYEHSDIRAWLNGDFYGSAFALEDSAIQTTEVDNSASTTGSSSNEYACANTTDKVFLPSYQNYLEREYGFTALTSASETRECKVTDWARARGADLANGALYPSDFNNGGYWTRSPGPTGYGGLWCVNYDGALTYDSNNNGFVRPALTLALSTVTQALSVTSSDESKGTATIAYGSGYPGESVTVVATSTEGYAFKGWYAGNTKVSDEMTFTFRMPRSDYNLVAYFWTQEENAAWGAAHGAVPALSNDGKTITYGHYPQTRVSDPALVSVLNALPGIATNNGWYYYDGEYYAKLRAKPSKSDLEFNDGTTIVSGTTYWFKCEPIKWGVLSQSDGEYYVLSDTLLDVSRYFKYDSTRTIGGKTVYPNNYEHSDIRAWLNGDFYDSAFALGNAAIQTTEVDNSVATTNGGADKYVCANTQDKVFLPNVREYINMTDAFRRCAPTDWAKAKGAPYWDPYYWSRSPANAGYTPGLAVQCVSYNGNWGNTQSAHREACIRPSISLKIA